MSVELHCVGLSNRPRIRIAAYINEEGRRYDDVYDNALNCSFPKDIRQLGKIYRVPAQNITLRTNANGKSWYTVKTIGIEEILGGAPPPTTVYEIATECVICMSGDCAIVFAPCGHLCTCSDCAKQIKNCCICRKQISTRLPKA